MIFVCVVRVSVHSILLGDHVQWDVRRIEIGSLVGSTRKHSGDVLPYHPAGAEVVNNSKKDEGQVTARISQARSESGDGEGLTWGSSANKVGAFDLPLMVLGHVPEMGNFRMVGFDDGDGKWLDLTGPHTGPAEALLPNVSGPNAVADAQVFHGAISFRRLGRICSTFCMSR